MTQAQPKTPNVVLIISDDLFANIGPYGNELIQTPNMDRLAARGTTFERAYTNYPLCGPSRNCMMTGRYAEDTGLPGLRDLIRPKHPNLVSLSQHFMNNGYAAARVGKIYHADNPDGIGSSKHDDPESWQIALNPSGYDKTIEGKVHRISDRREGVPYHEGLGAQLSWYADPIGTDAEHTDGMVATEAIQLMQQYSESDTPFFLGVGFYKPHTPFVAPKKYFDRYKQEAMVVPNIPDNYLASLPDPAAKSIRSASQWKPGQIDIPHSLAQEVIHAYYASTSYLDACLGRVLDAIENMGIDDNTIVVFLSDHGFHLGEHGHWQKHTLFGQADQIPLIIAAPGADGGQRSVSMVEMVDLYRTLSDLAGLPEPTWTAGQSFAGVLKNPEQPARDNVVSGISVGEDRHYTIRTETWRYTRWGDGGPDMIELYDLQRDPDELHNLAKLPEYTSRIETLDRQLDTRLSIMAK